MPCSITKSSLTSGFKLVESDQGVNAWLAPIATVIFCYSLRR